MDPGCIGSLIERIEAEFPEHESPGWDEVLYEGHYKNDPELEEIRQFFAGRSWRTVTPQDVFRFRHALSFFSAKAFVYFTPAWMRCCLLDVEAVDTAVDDLVWDLERKDPELWSEGQRRTICEWLRVMDRWNTEHWESALFRASLLRAARKLGCRCMKSSGNATS